MFARACAPGTPDDLDVAPRVRRRFAPPRGSARRKTAIALLLALVAPRAAAADPPAATPPRPAVAPFALPKFERGGFTTGATPPLPRAFVKVALADVHGALIGVRGRTARDVWFLSDEEFTSPLRTYQSGQGVLVHYDGKGVIEQIRPLACYGAAFTSLEIGPEGVFLAGANYMSRGISQETALLPRRGDWQCYRTLQTVRGVPGRPSVSLACSTPAQWTDCRLRAAGGARYPSPVRAEIVDGREQVASVLPPGVTVVAPDDAFAVLRDDEGRNLLHRLNGVTWAPVADLGDLDAPAIWVDEQRSAWIAGPGAALRVDGRTLERIAVPDDFAPTLVLGSSRRDVWFFAGWDVFQFDGKVIHRGKAPFEVKDAWVAPDGEVWIVGAGGEKAPKGLAAHTPSLAEAGR